MEDGQHVYVVWQDSPRAGGIHVNASSDNGATWLESDIILNEDPTEVKAERAQVGAKDGYAYVAWQNYDWEIAASYSIDGGQNWSPEIRLDVTDPGFTSSEYAALHADRGDLHVVYEDRRDGNRDIYYASATIPHITLEGSPTAGQPVYFALHEAAEKGAEGLVLISLTGDTGGSGGILIPGTYRHLDIVPDDFTRFWFDQGYHLTGPIADGEARTPAFILPAGTPPGLPVWAAAATWDPIEGRYISVTRTIQFTTQ